jgi:deoxyribose-phosphate aldolase
MTQSLRSIAKALDHSLLHPTLTDEELREGCRFAGKHDVAAVSIKPYAVGLAKEILDGSDVAVGAVVGFPHGNSRIEIKVKEAELACADGATELDAVVNIGKVLSLDWDYVSEEIRRLNQTAVENHAILKVIFENDYLSDDALRIKLCRICNQHAVAFVKTSTGYGFVKQESGLYAYKGATDHDLKLMRAECVPSVQVKAAGGVRTLDDVLRVLNLGVTRIGVSATEAILTEARQRGFK